MDLEWLNGLKRDWEIGKTTVSRTISFPGICNIPAVFPDLTLAKTCIECRQKKLKKCPYLIENILEQRKEENLNDN